MPANPNSTHNEIRQDKKLKDVNRTFLSSLALEIQGFEINKMFKSCENFNRFPCVINLGKGE